ncbi:alpha/beta hydrolase [Xylariales sp. PMI_506]|nr:alpha/beta hydrolase [Xylariales sp. PMI_506]
MGERQSLRQQAPRAEEWIAQCETLVSRCAHHLSFRRRGSGPPVVLLHGFPTWSYDYAAVATDLESDYDVITLDFLGYGASDKPNPYEYSVEESADSVEDLIALLGLSSVHLVVHDYGGIVGQELIDRHLSEKLPFGITGLAVLNCGIVYSAYRPTFMQKLLNTPIIGKLIAGRVTASTLRSLLAGVWGKSKLSDEEFDSLWHGVSLKNGHQLSHLLIRYNTERDQHHRRWEAALTAWKGPLHLIWGLDDPVSGRHVLEQATKMLPRAVVVELDGVGHFPQTEAPEAVASAIRASLNTHTRSSL